MLDKIKNLIIDNDVLLFKSFLMILILIGGINLFYWIMSIISMILSVLKVI